MLAHASCDVQLAVAAGQTMALSAAAAAAAAGGGGEDRLGLSVGGACAVDDGGVDGGRRSERRGGDRGCSPSPSRGDHEALAARPQQPTRIAIPDVWLVHPPPCVAICQSSGRATPRRGRGGRAGAAVVRDARVHGRRGRRPAPAGSHTA